RQHHRPKHRVLQLAHIPRPSVADEHCERLGIDARYALALLGGEASEEMPDQFGDILRPLGEGRDADREYVQPIEQILAEAAGFHIGDEVAVGGGDDPHVDLYRPARADRLDLVSLDRAQQLHLRGGRKLANFVEEQRAAGCFHELARVALGRAGEGALLVAEQDRLDEIVGDGATIDRHEWLGAPLASAMDGARDQLFADARLAFDEYRDRRVRRLLGGAQHGEHARAACDDVAERERAGTAALEAGQLARECAGRERIAQRYLQPLDADRLDYEIGRAGPHRGDHVVDAAMGG